MTVKRIQSSRPTFTDVPEVLHDLEQVLASGRLMLGPYLEQFEAAFAALVGTRHAIGVTSCTSALEIVLRYVGVEGGEVIVPTNTFLATANAVRYAGGAPVLADIHPETLALDAVNVTRALSPRTKAVILVHLAGLIPADVTAIRLLCEARRIVLIEDCAHAHGAAFAGTRAGAFGLAGCFSFYPTKVMTTGTGGMITTDDAALSDFARSVRLHGRGAGPGSGQDALERLGNDWFLDEVRSVLGLHQLRHLEETLARRRALAERYLTRLQTVPGVKPVASDARCRPSWYKFMVLVDPPASVESLQRVLLEQGIESERLYWPPCHLQPVWRRLFGGREGMFPVAEEALRRQLCLPLHPALSEGDVDDVVESLERELMTTCAPR